jgi:hypothetical protein
MFACLASASASALLLLLLLLKTIYCIQLKNIKNIQKNALIAQQELIQIIDEIDSIFQTEFDSNEDLLKIIALDDVEEVSLTPLVMDEPAETKPKLPKLIGFDDVNWDAYSFSSRAQIHQAIVDGTLNEMQLLAFDRNARLENADPPFENRRQLDDPLKKLKYDDINWDKFSYAARARIFYLITNESMTAADLLQYNCELLNRSVESGIIAENYLVEVDEPVDPLPAEPQNYSCSNRAQIHNTAAIPLTMETLRTFEDDDRHALDGPFVEPKSISLSKVTLSDIDWGKWPSVMRSRIFFLISNDLLSLAELRLMEFEVVFANPKRESYNEANLNRLAQWQQMQMQPVVQLYSDSAFFASDPVPPDDACFKRNQVRWTSNSFSSRAQNYPSICNSALTSDQLLLIPKDTRQQVHRPFAEKRSLLPRTVLAYNDADWGRYSYANAMRSNVTLTSAHLKLLEFEEYKNYRRRKLECIEEDSQGHQEYITDLLNLQPANVDSNNCYINAKYLTDTFEFPSTTRELKKSTHSFRSSFDELTSDAFRKCIDELIGITQFGQLLLAFRS